MIIYFCDRELNILGQASTVLPAGNRISADKLVEDVETGVNSFEGFVTWDDNTRQELESAVVAGNYILKKSDTEYDSLFQIIETESDTKAQEISFYSEDAGLDLLNTLCPAVTLTNRTLKQMLTYFMPAGWTINVTDAPTTTKTYMWDGESTCTERIRSVVSLWDCELYYSFRVEELQVKERIVNVTRKRGLQEAIPQLRLNYDIDRIVTKTSIADLVTALSVTGGTPDGSQTPINLKNYTYNYTDPVTGDRYTVDKTTGQMRNKDAMARWSSVIDTDGLWVGSFSYETTDKAVLAGQARAELQRLSVPAVNYEVDFATLPEDAQIGDRVNIIDDEGELYLEARLLKIETCEADGTKTATIGEYLLKSSGITEQVIALAEQVKQQAESDAQTKEQIQILTESVDSMLTLEVSSQIIQGQAHLKAKLLNGNKDVTEEHSPALYKWILRKDTGERLLGRGYTLNVDLETFGYAGTILCRFIRPELYDLTDHNLTVITDQDGNAIQVSYAGLYSQPVVQRMRSLKALNKASNTRAVQTEETGYATLSREVNLYERGNLDKELNDIRLVPQHFWAKETGLHAGVHITEVPQEDFIDDPAAAGGNTLITSDAFVIRDGLTELAKFSANGVVQGQENETHTLIDYHSLQLINKERETYFYVSDLRDKDGIATLYSTKIASGSRRYFEILPNAIDTNYTVTIDGVPATNISEKTTAGVNFSTAPAAGSKVVIKYTTNGKEARAFTFGTRAENSPIGANSVAIGKDCEASGYNSFASGYGCMATGEHSHAEGDLAKATGYISHAEGLITTASGFESHAEGCLTVASGEYSHAEGDGCIASGDMSHAQNNDTIAAYWAQTAMGEYNRNKEADILEVGNGSSSARSNALELTRTGKLTIAGTLTQSSDRRLKEHVAYLGDEAIDFIDQLQPVHFIKDGEHHTGFYAQDVESVDKWHSMVGEMNGFKTLAYTDLIAPLVKYCQSLEKRIGELEGK